MKNEKKSLRLEVVAEETESHDGSGLRQVTVTVYENRTILFILCGPPYSVGNRALPSHVADMVADHVRWLTVRGLS